METSICDFFGQNFEYDEVPEDDYLAEHMNDESDVDSDEESEEGEENEDMDDFTISENQENHKMVNFESKEEKSTDQFKTGEKKQYSKRVDFNWFIKTAASNIVKYNKSLNADCKLHHDNMLIPMLKFQLNGSTHLVYVIPHVAVTWKNEVRHTHYWWNLMAKSDIDKWIYVMGENPQMHNCFKTRMDESVALDSQTALVGMLERMKMGWCPSQSLKKLVESAKSNYNQGISVMRDGSDEITAKDIYEESLNNPSYQKIDQETISDLLKSMNNIKTGKKYYSKNEIRDSGTRYGNLKRTNFPINYIPEKREVLERIISDLGFVYNDENTKPAMTANVVQGNLEASLTARKFTDFKKKSKIAQALSSKFSEPKTGYEPVDILTVEDSTKWGTKMELLYNLIKQDYEELKTNGLAALDENSYFLDLTRKCIKANLTIDAIKSVPDPNLQEELKDLLEYLESRPYVLNFSLCKEATAHAALDMLKMNNKKVADCVSRVHNSEHGNVLQLFRPGVVSKGMVKEVRAIQVGRISRKMKSIIMSESFQAISILFSKENKQNVHFIERDGKLYFVSSQRFRSNEESNSVNYTSLVSALRSSRNEADREELERFAVLSNITCVRVAEELYFWYRILVLLKSTYILNRNEMMSEINSKWKNEPYIQHQIIKLLKGEAKMNPLMWVSYAFPRLSKSPTSGGMSNTEAGLFKTVEAMMTFTKTYSTKADLSDINKSKFNNKINFNLLERAVTANTAIPLSTAIELASEKIFFSGIEAFYGKGTKLDPHCGSSKPAVVAGVHMSKATNASSTMDLMNYFADNYLEDTDVKILKSDYDKVIYLSLCGHSFEPMPKRRRNKIIYEKWCATPDSITIKFRTFARFLTGIKAVVKENERNRDSVRSIFLMSYFIFQITQGMEWLARVMLKVDNPKTTIELGEYERKTMISNRFKIMNEKGGTIFPVCADQTKWHACFSTLTFTYVLLNRLDSLSLMIGTYEYDVIQDIKEYIYFGDYGFSVKRIICSSMKTFYIDGIEMQAPYTYTELNNVQQSENDYMISSWFKRFTDVTLNKINEGKLGIRTMTLALGLNHWLGFCMGFMNILSTKVHDMLIKYLQVEITKMIGIYTKAYDELHSSDDALQMIQFLNYPSEKFNFNRECMKLFNKLNEMSDGDKPKRRKTTDGDVSQQDSIEVLADKLKEALSSKNTTIERVAFEIDTVEKEIIHVLSFRRLYYMLLGINSSLKKDRACGPMSDIMSFEYTSAFCIPEYTGDKDGVKVGFIESFIRDSRYSLSLSGETKALNDISATSKSMITTGTMDYPTHYANMITLMHRFNVTYHCYDKDRMDIYNGVKSLIKESCEDEDETLIELCIPNHIYLRYVPLGRQCFNGMKEIIPLVIKYRGSEILSRICSLNTRPSPAFARETAVSYENLFGKETPEDIFLDDFFSNLTPRSIAQPATTVPESKRKLLSNYIKYMRTTSPYDWS